MTERDWQRLERNLIDGHTAADAPLSDKIWRGVESTLAARRSRRGIGFALGAVVVAAAAIVALWFLPGEPPWWRAGDARVVQVGSAAEATTATGAAPSRIEGTPAATGAGTAATGVGGQAATPSVAAAAGVRVAGPPLNQVLEPARAVTFVMAADAGRIEIEPCRGRFVNVTVLDSPHRSLELVQSGRRIEVRLDGGAQLASGVAHVLVPADTHLILSTRTGPIVVRGLGGPMEIDSQSGEVRVDSAPRVNPQLTIVSDSGAIVWQGRCGNGCRVEARSREGDITLRAPDRSVMARGAVRGQSERGGVHFEELICTDSRCASSPLPWRQLAPGQGH
ncbi:MAG TPA: hypothetical protein VLM79_37525 [Kofleriaceae bacterium]|nr:hypothetical protein [Kofleriaceae bacterium]